MKYILIFLGLLLTMNCTFGQTMRVATFNVSMEATNYSAKGEQLNGGELFAELATGKHPQIKNIAAIIQQVRPDIILLNEFDYTSDDSIGVSAFINNYLHISQQGAESIDYPYFYTAPVNTGVDSGLDLDKDGVASGKGADAFGFGLYPGQYGMVLLSRYPIDNDNVRTFQHFLWKDMPDNLMVTVKDEQDEDWYSPQAQKTLRLSSKSHWDVPITVEGKTIHILASHPTPPSFDGPENHNGKRNHDEVRFWNDYLAGEIQSAYIYDDKGARGGLSQSAAFVVLGDLNSSAEEGDAMREAISALVYSPLVIQYIPKSEGGKMHTPDNSKASTHTAEWRLRADYVLPSVSGFKLIDSGIFWPQAGSKLAPLVADRRASSDHRLVWIELVLQ